MDVLMQERPDNVPADRVVDFDIYAPPGGKQDFHAAWKTLQVPGAPALMWTPRNGGHWIATRFRVLNEVFADYERFSNRVNILPKALGEKHTMLPTMLDPPAHRPFRILLNDSLSPKAVRGLEPRIRDIAVELIEAVREQGHCNFTTAYAEVFPVRIFFSMMELPLEDAAEAAKWTEQMLRPSGVMTFEEASEKLFTYLRPFVEERMGGDGTDMLSRVINGRVNGEPLTMDQAMQLAVQILIAGLDTVVNFLGFAMLHLARNPEQRRELAADPSRIPHAVEELLRRYPIVVIAREVVGDIDYEGVALKKGDMVCIPTPLGGLDDEANACPMDVDFDRSGFNYVTFGNGHHKCPGAHLARNELRITLEEWLSRIPEFSVTPGAEVQFTGGIVGVVDALPLVWDVATTRGG